MRTPSDKPLSFVFVSFPAHEMKMRWSAKLNFKGSEDSSSVLDIEVHDGEGEAVKKGVFEFAGQMLAVNDGLTKISYADFIAGKHDRAIWLHRKGFPPIPGDLTFA